MSEVFDIVVVGSGPTGLSAAITAGSEGFRVAVATGHKRGGQPTGSMMIENYPGFPDGISGEDLMERFSRQAVQFGARFFNGEAMALRPTPGGWEVAVQHYTIQAPAVIVASGVTYKMLDVPGGTAHDGKGVYYAATENEAAEVEGKVVAVVGAGNAAAQAVLFLCKAAKQVHYFWQADNLNRQPSAYLRDRLAKGTCPQNVTLHSEKLTAIARWDTNQPQFRLGLEYGSSVRLVHSLFVFTGGKPKTEWLPTWLDKDLDGYIITDWFGIGFATSLKGVFAAGDCRKGSKRRLVAALAEGSLAASQVKSYLENRPEPKVEARKESEFEKITGLGKPYWYTGCEQSADSPKV